MLTVSLIFTPIAKVYRDTTLLFRLLSFAILGFISPGEDYA